MKILRIIIVSFILMSIGPTVAANNGVAKKQLIERYAKELASATSARDSVRILYSLFDLSDRRGQIKYAWELYYTAVRAENVNAQLDMLRNLGTFYAKDDSIVRQLLGYADRVSNASARAATKTFILNQHVSRKGRNPADNHLQMMLLDSIRKSHDLNGGDVYDKISLLYQIIQYLGVDADGVLFKECLDRYAELLDELPTSDYPLKNQFYTTAAMIHTRMNGNPRKAIQSDRNLITIIEQLQQMYQKKNRNFRNYDTNKFISYRRMLSNYQALTAEEIEEIHDSIQTLYDRDPDVRSAMDKDGQAFAFYYMATRNYKEAIPALKGMLKDPDMSAYQKQKFNSMLIDASKAIGDKDTYIESMENYILFSKKIDSLRRITMRREIMLRDSILSRPLLYRESPADTKHSTLGKHGNEITLTILASVLAALLIVYIILYFRLRLKYYNK